MTPQEAVDALRAAVPPGYTVDQLLDGGGQGAVFLGTFNGEQVALKLFKPGGDPRRLQRELDLLGDIGGTCANLVSMRAWAQVTFAGQNAALVAYEFHPGGNLRTFIACRPPLGAADVIRLGLDVSNAIETLWSRRIVHRDVKPANIVVATNGRFVLLDVGLARHVDLSDITALGGAPGTPGYKSPEQARGRRRLTIHSDVFSLGVTMFEAACRQHPFLGDQARIGLVPPVDLGALRPDLPPQLVRLVLQMLAVAPSGRPNDVNARLRVI